jgi:hypothetical protein
LNPVDELPFDLACAQAQAQAIDDPRERLKFVRDFIASIPEDNFNMITWGDTAQEFRDRIAARGYDLQRGKHPCGTVACIGGWTEKLWQLNSAPNVLAPSKLLGLTAELGQELFYPQGAKAAWYDITNAQAVQVLDHLLDTGEVDWSIIND